MNIEEIREAASSAAIRIGQDRIDYINNFPEEYRKDIEYLTNKIEEASNNHYDSYRLDGEVI